MLLVDRNMHMALIVTMKRITVGMQTVHRDMQRQCKQWNKPLDNEIVQLQTVVYAYILEEIYEEQCRFINLANAPTITSPPLETSDKGL